VSEPLLAVRDLSVTFDVPGGPVRAVRGVSFSIERGETLALVGESGSGKSVTALSIVQLLPYPPARHPGGSIRFQGRELLGAPERVLRGIRGDRIGMIFQEPMTSLNPLHTIERQVSEALVVHRGLGREAARTRTLELLRLVGLGEAERRRHAYPHQLSGGQRQRVMIAMALANEPDLLIADEPTTALDVTIQAQILDLMRNLRDETGTAIILITHDLGVVAEMCDRVAVMYAGEIVEQADVTTLFRRPKHPYTRGLIASIPVVGAVLDELAVIPGNVPNLIDLPKGCRFAPRCLTRIEQDVALATEVHPELLPVAEGHDVRCWVYHDAAGRLLPTDSPAIGAGMTRAVT
jgi:peptide/nickel transport system ATP-binding protein